MVNRKVSRPYIAALAVLGAAGGRLLQHLFGWDDGPMIAGAVIVVAAAVGIARIRNKIRTGRWTVAPESAVQTDE
jgi:hypothetical protein